MNERRIAVYIKGATPKANIPLAQIYPSQFCYKKIVTVSTETHQKKTEIVRRLLMNFFNTEDLAELTERILYAADVTSDDPIEKRKIANVCNKAVKSAIDNGYLLSLLRR